MTRGRLIVVSAAIVVATAASASPAQAAREARCVSLPDLPLLPTSAQQVDEAVQLCERESSMTPGADRVHVRLTIEATGHVRRVMPFDQKDEPVSASMLRCLRASSARWSLYTGENRCVEVASVSESIPRDVLGTDEKGSPLLHYEDELSSDFATAGWWAVCGDGDMSLRPVTVSAIHIKCEDDGGREIRLAGCAAPVFLLKGVPTLEARAVPSAALSRAAQDMPPTTISFRGETRRLEVKGRDVWLVGRGARQWLLRLPSDDFSARNVGVRWAGDVDGDGKLDVLVEAQDEDSFDYLYLSSFARRGESLHVAAASWAASCHDTGAPEN
ncbi:MAG TPA: hypothetical protein VHJ20_16620 [Polyangia bacterium]|nr:hypothetical protein [Polyangia bacterium]